MAYTSAAWNVVTFACCLIAWMRGVHDDTFSVSPLASLSAMCFLWVLMGPTPVAIGYFTHKLMSK